MATTALGGLRARLPKLKPWVTAAIVVGLVLVLYYGFQARKYLTDSGALAVSDSKIQVLDQAIREAIPERDAIEQEVEERTRLLDEWKSAFSVEGYPTTTDPLLAIVSATAQETGVALSSISLGKQVPEAEGRLQYQVQILYLEMTGETFGEIYRFISRLHEKIPALDVSDVSLSGFGGGRSANAGLRFYFAPELASQQ